MEIWLQIMIPILIAVFMTMMGWVVNRLFYKIDVINKMIPNLATKKNIIEAKEDLRREIDLLKDASQDNVKIVGIPVNTGRTVYTNKEHI